VPGCVDMLDSGQPLRVPGKLFADDTMGLAQSLDNLHAMFAPFSLWAEDHYMGFAFKKCGVMALGRHSDVVTLREEVWGMDSTSGVNGLQTILNQCVEAPSWVGCKDPWGGHNVRLGIK
jgi:hypothetical protein